MTMRRLEPKLDIHAFCYVADDSEVNEENWMDIVGGASGAALHKVRADPDTLVSDLSALINTQGECFGGTSIYAQRQIFRSARDAGIKVMLDGQGADELLCGYERYVPTWALEIARSCGGFAALRGFVRMARNSRRGLRGMSALAAYVLLPPLRRRIVPDAEAERIAGVHLAKAPFGR